jgi:hypothetical protein
MGHEVSAWITAHQFHPTDYAVTFTRWARR